MPCRWPAALFSPQSPAHHPCCTKNRSHCASRLPAARSCSLQPPEVRKPWPLQQPGQNLRYVKETETHRSLSWPLPQPDHRSACPGQSCCLAFQACPVLQPHHRCSKAQTLHPVCACWAQANQPPCALSSFLHRAVETACACFEAGSHPGKIFLCLCCYESPCKRRLQGLYVTYQPQSG